MDDVLLARIQFAVTVGVHVIFPPISIGLAWLLVVFEWPGWRRGDEAYVRRGRFFGKPLALTFAVGVATGIVMEFQFGTNWAQYSKYVGDIFGAARHRFAGRGPSAFTWLFGALFVAAALGHPFATQAHRFGLAFLASSVAIAAQIGLAAAALFPRLVPARPDLALSLTIYNAASSPRTQAVMLVIAVVGMPFVVAYTIWIYRAFRGPTVLTETSD